MGKREIWARFGVERGVASSSKRHVSRTGRSDCGAKDLLLAILALPVPPPQLRAPTPPLPTTSRIKPIVPVPAATVLSFLGHGYRCAIPHERYCHKCCHHQGPYPAAYPHKNIS